MKYRLTRLGKIVVYSLFISLLFIAFIFILNLNNKKLNAHFSSLPDINPATNSSEHTIPNDDYSKEADITNQQDTPQPSEPNVAEIKDNSDIIKNTHLSIYFDPNVSILQKEYFEALNLFIDAAQALEGSIIQIEGNCATTVLNKEDEKNNSSNYSLSLYRAQAIADYLIKAGIKADRLIIIGNGSEKPLKSNDTPEGRKHNRRVDIFFKAAKS